MTMATESVIFQKLRLNMLGSFEIGIALTKNALLNLGPIAFDHFFASFARLTTVLTKALPTSILVFSAIRTTKRSSFTFVIVP